MGTSAEALEEAQGRTGQSVSREHPVGRLTMAVMMVGRLAINMQYRIIFPYLPQISQGLGVSLEMGSLLVTARSLVGISSPLYGMLADRFGRKTMMLVGLAALVIGASLVAITPGFGLALVAFAVLGVCRGSYEPANQALISDHVSYGRRGRTLGVLELPWSLSWLIGVPLAGFLIAAAGWRSPFVALAVLGLVSLLITWRTLPSYHARIPAGSRAAISLKQGLRAATRTLTGPVLAVTSVSALVAMASANIILIYGAWFQQQYGLAVAALGLVSITISVAELAAESASTGFVDRLGKRRALLMGIGLNLVAYLLLPHIAATLVAGIIAMTVVALTSEFCMVSALPLMSELTQNARGVVMATNAALISIAVLVDSLIAPRLWNMGGLEANALVSAGLVLLAGLILWRSGLVVAIDRHEVTQPALTDETASEEAPLVC